MVNTNYIDCKTFDDFKINQDTLIGVLNHNMTKITVDVQWLKAQGKWVVGILTAILITAIIGTIF